jgi:hypothetical protein
MVEIDDVEVDDVDDDINIVVVCAVMRHITDDEVDEECVDATEVVDVNE